MEWLPLAELLELRFYYNPMAQWMVALAIFLCVQLVMNLSRRILGNRIAAFAATTETDLDDFAADLIRSLNGFFIVTVAIFLATLVLELPETAGKVVRLLPIFGLLLQVALWGGKFIDFSLNRYVTSRETEEQQLATRTMMSPVRFIGLMMLWTVLAIVALDNLGMDITALVAGLGVGGVAVALAVQNILGDLFAAMSIVIDKPFVIGDFITVGEMAGTVEHIGLKTTRVRSLGGEQLVFSNSDLLQSRIRNFKRLFERRVLFRFGLVYQTKREHLREIPALVREVIESRELTRFDRAHFFAYGASSLDFEVVYFVLDSEYNTYMDIQQDINLELFRRFDELGVQFAYPTQTLFVVNDGEAAEEMQPA